MLPKTKLLKQLKSDLKATKDYLEERLSCMTHKDKYGRSFHHGEVITNESINELELNIAYIQECISKAEDLSRYASIEDCIFA